MAHPYLLRRISPLRHRSPLGGEARGTSSKPQSEIGLSCS
jgi:hypothetical protein